MEVVPTRHGLVGMQATSATDCNLPLVVVVRGAFPPPHQLGHLCLPGTETVFIELPSFNSPPFRVYSLETFAEAFNEAVEKKFPNRRPTLVGVSTGATVALMMKARSVLAIEPFLATGPLWPLRKWVLANPLGDEHARFAQQVFLEDHVYVPHIGLPTTVIVGAEPLLPERRTSEFPSLTSASDRADLRALGCKMVEIPGGHDLTHRPELPAELSLLLSGGNQ